MKYVCTSWREPLLLALLTISSLMARAQNVGIGTTTPAGLLDVTAPASTGSAALDQQANGSGAGGNGTTPSYQTFTAGVTGQLQRLAVYANGYNGGAATLSGTLSVYQGAGTGGTLLASQALTVPATYPPIATSVTFTSPASLTTGQVYTWQVTTSTGYSGYGLCTNNCYAGGTSSFNSTTDYNFETYMAVSTAAQSALLVKSTGVGIGTLTPSQKLEVAGQVFSSTGGFRFPDNTVQTTAAPTVTGTNFVQNQAAKQTAANFNVDGSGTVGGLLTAGSAAVAGALTGSGATLNVVGVGIRADGGLNLGQNTTGTNLYVGYQAGNDNTTGTNNHMVGVLAGQRNTTGTNNFMEGPGAGQQTTTGGGNLFMGWLAGQNGNGDRNLAIGMQAGRANTASDNQFVGFYAGAATTTGSGNTFEGNYSGVSNTIGGQNTFVGYQAGNNNSTGSSNLGLGYRAGPAAGSGALTNAGAIGYNARVSQSNSLVLGGTGTDAVSVGIGTSAPAQALDVVGNIQSSANIAVDYNNTNVGTVANTLRFGPANSGEAIGSKRTATGNQFGLDFYTSSINRMSINGNGNLGIGTTAPATKLDVNGNLRLAVRLCPVNSSNAYTLTANDIAYSIFKMQDGASATPLTLPPAGTGQVEGQELTIVNAATILSSVSGANTDSSGTAVGLAGSGTGVHAVKYVWATYSSGSGAWFRVQ